LFAMIYMRFLRLRARPEEALLGAILPQRGIQLTPPTPTGCGWRLANPTRPLCCCRATDRSVPPAAPSGGTACRESVTFAG